MKTPGSLPDGDTIAAVSTPYGIGGIGIVRITGARAEEIARALFRPKRPLPHFLSHRLYYGHIVDPVDNVVVDEALVVLMRAPRSYTKEDVVEIQCHGGYLPVQRVLELVLAQGCRLALPGEFTQRAFLNGRIDLAQAEAVLDLIEAKTRIASRCAQQQLAGALSLEIERIRGTLQDLLVRLEAEIDFPDEEGVPATSPREMVPVLERCDQALGELASTYQEGHLYRDGMTVVIAGKPNVGKSTLMNALLGRDRALVSPTPGTTRDFIDGELSIGGIPVRIVDTAGLRPAREGVEALGIEAARDQIAKADAVLLLFDASSMGPSDVEECVGWVPEKERVVVVLNKIDLVGERALLERPKGPIEGFPQVMISALHGHGIEALKRAILDLAVHTGIDLDSRVIVTNTRHYRALQECRAALDRARAQLEGCEPYVDLVAADVRDALDRLGEILGTTAGQDILASIFSRFCIGK